MILPSLEGLCNRIVSVRILYYLCDVVSQLLHNPVDIVSACSQLDDLVEYADAVLVHGKLLNMVYQLVDGTLQHGPLQGLEDGCQHVVSLLMEG